MLAATIDFEFEREAIAFIERRQARTLNRGNVNKGIGLSIIPLDETEALHGVEELDGALRLLAGQLALRSFLLALNRNRLTFDLDIRRGNASAAIDQSEAERLPFR